ncbi:MAG TPA: hypothetical protein VNG90_01640 [Candidatus Acidoferrum sp.]|nr:hypothetical protein [Candidatus Acidoferrum sp.]
MKEVSAEEFLSELEKKYLPSPTPELGAVVRRSPEPQSYAPDPEKKSGFFDNRYPERYWGGVGVR